MPIQDPRITWALNLGLYSSIDVESVIRVVRLRYAPARLSAERPRYETIAGFATFWSPHGPSIGEAVYPPTPLPVPVDPSLVAGAPFPDKTRVVEPWAGAVVGNTEEELRSPCDSV